MTNHLVVEDSDKYMEQPSYKSLRTIVLPIAFLGFTLLLAFILLVTKDKIEIMNNKDYPFLFLISAMSMQVLAIILMYFH